MRAGLALLLLAVGVAAAQRPPIPTLAKQFQANYTVRALRWDPSSQILFHGRVAVDDVNGGGFFSLTGEEFIPIGIETHMVAHPFSENITGYIYEQDICWSHSVDKSWIQVLPLKINDNATFLGYEEIRGVKCQGWGWDAQGSKHGFGVKMFVTDKEANAGIMELTGTDNTIFGDVRWEFYHEEVGRVDPKVYAPPDLKCTSPLLEGPFKRNPLKKFITLLKGLAAE